MSIKLLLLLAICWLTACQEEEPWTRVGLLYEQQAPKPAAASLVGDWVRANGNIWASNSLDLKPDSTFEYLSANCLGISYSAGTWRKMSQVIVLKSYDRFAQPRSSHSTPLRYVAVAEPVEEIPVATAWAGDALPADASADTFSIDTINWKLPDLASYATGTFRLEMADAGALQPDSTYTFFNNEVIILQGDSLCPVKKQGALSGNYGRRNTQPTLPVKPCLFPLQ